MYKAVNEFCTGWLHGNFYLVGGMKIWWGSLLGWIFRVQINFVQCCQENLPTIYPSLALSCVFKEEIHKLQAIKLNPDFFWGNGGSIFWANWDYPK